MLIMEVFSPFTKTFVRHTEWAHDQRMPSLREYVLVARDTVRVEGFVRDDTGWHHSAVTSLDDVLHLTSIECELPVSDIHDGVGLPTGSFAMRTTPVG